ncbi:hypothetical protein AB0E10_09905 [Streptomyces sp. NPDC048045]|uniref:hypothetical protein n=1 Tax=Streptomyces sp. NPDC048045 TaxID=3154710 RepID=UPI0034390A63
MTQQGFDGAPRADAADVYLEAVRGRLAADGCGVTATTWAGHRVLIGSRSDRRLRWFGTKVELFVLATTVPEVDKASIAEFTRWALNYVRGVHGGLPGARNAAMVLPALVSGTVQPSAEDWAAQDARVVGTSVVGWPVTARTTTSRVTRVTMYRGRVAYGGMFKRHVLEKASLYFP